MSGIPLLGCLAGSAVLLTSCGSAHSSPADSARAQRPQTVEVTRVVAKPLDVTVQLPGELEPYESVAIVPKVSGFVKWIAVDRGSNVRTGQEIARLVAPELVARRGEAESKAATAQAQLGAARAKLAADRSTRDKLQSASHTPGVIAGNDLLLAQKAVEADQAQVKARQGTAEGAKRALQAIAETEQYLRLRAPFDGVVTERNVHPGALVGPEQSTPIVRIETLDHLRLVVPVPETYVAAVAGGATVKFAVPAHPTETFTGTVARVAHLVNVKTRTMPAELDVDNAAGRLTPGSFAEVVWPVHRRSPSLFVPPSAIASNLERTFVVRVRDGRAEWVDVRAGASAGPLTEVFSDLRPGDVVVVRGTDELAPGTAVPTREREAGAP